MGAPLQKVFDTGLVFGKFYPLTKGHQFLISTAQRNCKRLFVAVCNRPSENIKPETRADWIRRLFPDVTVLILPSTLPYEPAECGSEDAFFMQWRDGLIAACGVRPDAIFTSEDYGDKVAHWLQCQHVCVDKARKTVPICATNIRANPFENWEFMDPVVRSHFNKTVCVFGPESCGKTTLCERLAKYYNTIWQPEYARELLGDRHCVYSDMEAIAEGHLARRLEMQERANKVLFVDTDAITTKIYSLVYFQKCPERVQAIINDPKNQFDLYLLLTPDIPWVPDPQRDLGTPELRDMMFRVFKGSLIEMNLEFETVNGTNFDVRFRRAVKAVEKHIFMRYE